VIMNYINLRREFMQSAREPRRAAQIAHDGKARPIPRKATTTIAVQRNVTPICPRHVKQLRFRPDRCQRLAKPRDRVGWAAMGSAEPAYDMHGAQRTLLQAGSGVRVAFCDVFVRSREVQPV